LRFSSGLLAANCGPDWPGIMALLAGENDRMHAVPNKRVALNGTTPSFKAILRSGRSSAQYPSYQKNMVMVPSLFSFVNRLSRPHISLFWRFGFPPAVIQFPVTGDLFTFLERRKHQGRNIQNGRRK